MISHDETIKLLRNVGAELYDIPSEIVSSLKDRAFNIQQSELNGKYNKNLAGNIKKEYEFFLNNSEKKWVQKVADNFYANSLYLQNNYSAILSKNCSFKLISSWINYQSKYEFNPPHTHSGLISYVIWLNIPFNIEDEMKYGPGNQSNTNVPGHFNISYFNQFGIINDINLPVDKKWEGKMLMFSSRTRHYVNPFYTSDDYRISLSGNIVFNTDNIKGKNHEGW